MGQCYNSNITNNTSSILNDDYASAALSFSSSRLSSSSLKEEKRGLDIYKNHKNVALHLILAEYTQERLKQLPANWTSSPSPRKPQLPELVMHENNLRIQMKIPSSGISTANAAMSHDVSVSSSSSTSKPPISPENIHHSQSTALPTHIGRGSLSSSSPRVSICRTSVSSSSLSNISPTASPPPATTSVNSKPTTSPPSYYQMQLPMNSSPTLFSQQPHPVHNNTAINSHPNSTFSNLGGNVAMASTTPSWAPQSVDNQSVVTSFPSVSDFSMPSSYYSASNTSSSINIPPPTLPSSSMHLQSSTSPSCLQFTATPYNA
ncbi:MAG: hypothetical protein QWI73_06900, partial [Alphaproteobacteria bacterium]|nr:hypothetical protein [Alphaproteobacteria bacterium]